MTITWDTALYLKNIFWNYLGQFSICTSPNQKKATFYIFLPHCDCFLNWLPSRNVKTTATSKQSHFHLFLQSSAVYGVHAAWEVKCARKCREEVFFFFFKWSTQPKKPQQVTLIGMLLQWSETPAFRFTHINVVCLALYRFTSTLPAEINITFDYQSVAIGWYPLTSAAGVRYLTQQSISHTYTWACWKPSQREDLAGRSQRSPSRRRSRTPGYWDLVSV